MIHQTVGHFEVLELLGKGGFGEVYKARDTVLGRIVALKVLPSECVGDLERRNNLKEEARAASALNHPHVCTIYELAEFSGGFYIAMELVDGQTLRQWIAEKAPSVAEPVRIGCQIAAALSEAHGRGIVHRDVTSANVMVTASGQVKIVDFGLAKIVSQTAIDRTAMTTLSQLGRPVGTLSYMPPEQLLGHRLTGRSDLFSFGVVLYELTTGRLPFRGASVFEIADQIQHREPERPTLANPEVPPALERLILQMLEKRPQDRPVSARAVLQELETLSHDLDRSVKPTSGGTMQRLRSMDEAVRSRSIAVLPFVNIGSDKDQEYFGDGLTEDLTNALANIEGLRIPSRTWAIALSRQHRDVREIASLLNVDTILQGSVRMQGNRLRISAQLINADNGYHIWSERYDRDMSDIFELQDDIARNIVEKLKGTLVTSSAASLLKRYTDDVDAYHLYLKGRYYWNRRHEGVLQKALEHFNKALERAPQYALAYSGVADCFNMLAFYSYVAPRDGFRTAEGAARKALAIDDELAEAHTSLGMVRSFFDWDFDAGALEFQRSIQLNPRYGIANHWYAVHEMVLGHWSAASDLLRRACEAEPLSINFIGAVAMLQYYSRNYDEAIDTIHKTLELEPQFGLARAALAWAYTQIGRHEDAVAESEQAIKLLGNVPAATASLAQTYALAGRSDEARQLLRELERINYRYVSSYHLAGLHVTLRQFDDAVNWLQRAFDEKSNWLPFMRIDPIMDPVRDRLQFKSIEASIFDR